MSEAKNLACIPKIPIRTDQMLRFTQHDNCWLEYGAIANGTAGGQL
jgi:hypothetical protein